MRQSFLGLALSACVKKKKLKQHLCKLQGLKAGGVWIIADLWVKGILQLWLFTF